MTCKQFTEEDVDRLLNMRLAIDVMRDAFLQWSAGHVDNVPRQRARGDGVVLHSMSAAADYLGLVGWKQYTTTRTGARFLVGLHRHDTGELAALIEADRLGQMRTGAVTGLAIELLRPEMQTVGLFGSGWQASSQLEAVAAACPTARAFVYSRDARRRGEFAERMSRELNLDVTAVTSADEAARDRDVVITATTSKTPVLDGNWLTDGTLVCAMGSNWPRKAEIDSVAVERAGLVVCDDVAACKHEAGDLAQAVERRVFDWADAVNLAEVAQHPDRFREQRGSIAIFKSVGLAIEDVALGGKLLELAVEKSRNS